MVLLITTGFLVLAAAVVYLAVNKYRQDDQLENLRIKNKAMMAYAEDMAIQNAELSRLLKEKVDELKACVNAQVVMPGRPRKK